MHAAAIIKAEQKGDAWLADRIYSGVPAGMFGREQEIEIGHMCGASNVNYWLEQHGLASTPATVAAVLKVAKEADHVLTEQEITHALAEELPARASGDEWTRLIPRTPPWCRSSSP